MPETDPKNPPQPATDRAAAESNAHRKPATHHGMEEYEEVFRRTDNPYQRINPHWPSGDDKSKQR